MAQKIVIDPITRIEGHLKVEVEIEGGKVTNAHASGTMARGLEVLLKGKDPRDATYVTERVCGVCAGSHGWVSSVAVENAQGAKLPQAARVLRNLILGAMWLHDHPLHFYHLSALDYLDVTAVAHYQGKDPKLLAVKDKIVKLVQSGDTSPLLPRYKPDEFSVNDPDLVTLAVSHYIKALEMQAKAKKMSAIFSGKQPHQSSIIAGGVTMLPDITQIEQFRTLLAEQADFVENIYWKDVATFGTGPLLPLARAGIGGGYGHYLTYGGFPLAGKGELFFPAGVIFDNQFGNVQPVDQAKITEAVKYSWYTPACGTKNPVQGDTVFDLNKPEAYSFIKAPRYDGKPMEVGPLARMLVLKPAPFMDIVTKYGIKPGAVARHAARAYETVLLAKAMPGWLDELEGYIKQGKTRIHDTEHWDPPATGAGIGMIEAPRGALGHWVEIANHKIANYQMVVPTTWNHSPRDENGQPGPLEQALIGVPVPDPENPNNIVRVVRSYDPCLACAIHIIQPESNRVLEFRIG
ncbi:periplasmic [NiFe] hydrogenase large subunit precursor [Peptococcaceae bacterium CEB3]|nr:periplasmic [NiFe] hydrogenase large subunit precursor [Peptococcaceae bacterium CEB3]